jgi:hypothetical protein
VTLLFYELAYVSAIVLTGSPLQPMGLLLVYLACMIILVALERTRFQPFPFLRPLDQDGYIFVASLMFGSSLFFNSVIPHLLGFRSHESVIGISTFPDYVVVALHAGISEESMKVAMISIGALVARKSRQSIRRIVIWVFGALVVALWASMHYFLNGFPLVITVLLGLSGMCAFGLIYWKGNYLPVIVGHTAWDIFAFASGTAFL